MINTKNDTKLEFIAQRHINLKKNTFIETLRAMSENIFMHSKLRV